MRFLLWPLFPRSAWSNPATELAGSIIEGTALSYVSSFVVCSDSYCVAVTTGKGFALASGLFVGVSTATYCGSRQDN